MSKQVGGDIPSLSTMSDLGAALPPGNGVLSAADRAGLVNILKDKLQYLAGQSSGYLESLPPKVKRRVVVLQELQSEHDELEAKFKEERAALEAKYQKLYEPLYSKRAKIVNGVLEVEPSKTEAPELNAASEEVGEEEKGVPQFWVTAMKTNEILAMQITERDEAALKYLKDIKWNNLDDNKGFLLEFYFDTNPYFKNPMVFPYLFYVKAVEVQRDSLHRVAYNFFLDILVSGLSSVGSFALALDQSQECSVLI